MERLQRVLAAAGVASRRRAEEMIVAGRVRVDGKVVTELGTQVDPSAQKIEVDGMIIPSPRLRYILLNKPKGYITTTDDERGRHTVMDLVQVGERVVPVGRLDRQTEGLLLLTNDGLVAHRVMHPSFEIDKEYEAQLDGHPPPAVLDRLRRGILVDGERAQPESVRPIKNVEDGTVVRIVLHEGRNRIVRRMFEEVGYPVLQLVRTRIGPLQLGDIPRGYWRDLREGELIQLREALRITDEDMDAQRHDPRRKRPESRGEPPPSGRPSVDGAPRPYRQPTGGPGRSGSGPTSRPDGDDRGPRRDDARPVGPPPQRWEDGRPRGPRPP
ncbi:MAG TPA: rRNA pseudouridine synthase, partial [Chloroflexi bacterium]|nr:rRNA pseudouridine synthase [Chloroflexota bacterium]